MAENITLADLANLENETTAVNVINNNNAIITSAFTDVLSLSGNSPNQMNSPLDMNSWPIMNLPAPGSANSPARLIDVTSTNPISISLSLTGDVTAPASSSALTTTVGKVHGVTYPATPSTNTVPVVTGSNTVTYQQIASAQISNNTVGNAQIRQGAPLSVVGNATNSTANVADISGPSANQVLRADATGTTIGWHSPRGDQLLGTATNDNASSGNVGEYISSFVAGNSVSLTSGTPVNITSISLTAGDWDIWVTPIFTPANTTTWTSWAASASTTSSSFSGSIQFNNNIFASVTPGANAVQPVCSVNRLSLTSTTTIFMVVQAAFGTSTMTAGGSINARRRR